MGTTAGGPGGSVRPEARARSQQRALRGELVHLTGASGSVKVKRAGSFAWEPVGSEGLTVNADDQVSIAKGARVTLNSQNAGARTITGSKGQVLTAAAPRQRLRALPDRTKIAVGMVRPDRGALSRR